MAFIDATELEDVVDAFFENLDVAVLLLLLVVANRLPNGAHDF